jgi:uncharacterized protein (DUF1810 family)
VSGDPYNLERFLKAQEFSFEQARAELELGFKSGHWMWFIFPQIDGLGHSPISRMYAIKSLDEARAYLAHPVLGPRLREVSQLVTLIEDHSVEEIFGDPDDLKLRSSITLFAQATPDNGVFIEVINKFFAGELDQRTLNLIGIKS